MPTQVGSCTLWPRGYTSVFFIFVYGLLNLIAVFVPIMYTSKTFEAGTAGSTDRTFKLTTTLFSQCGGVSEECRDTLDTITCEEQKSLMQSARAAYLVSCAVAGAAFVCALLNTFGKVLSKISSVLVVVAAVLGVVGVALAGYIFDRSFCDQPSYKDDPNVKLGPSIFLVVVGWFFLIPALILSLACEGGPHDSLETLYFWEDNDDQSSGAAGDSTTNKDASQGPPPPPVSAADNGSRGGSGDSPLQAPPPAEADTNNNNTTETESVSVVLLDNKNDNSNNNKTPDATPPEEPSPKTSAPLQQSFLKNSINQSAEEVRADDV